MHNASARVTLALALLAGCDPAGVGEAADARSGGFHIGPTGINNQAYRAFHYDTRLGGGVSRPLDGTQLESVTIHQGFAAFVLDDVWSQNGTLHGVAGDQEFGGADFVGSVWVHTVYDGNTSSTSSLTIAAFDPYGSSARYAFEWDDDHSPLCSVDADGESWAVVLGDIYLRTNGKIVERPDTLLVGCGDGAAAKAALWGYRPGIVDNLGYQAAIRMVIADYCGDGTSYTATGTGIQVTDVWGLHPELHPELPTEAGWTENGATCLSQPRNPTAAADIDCAAHLEPCGTDPIADGALLWTWDDDANDE